MQTNVFKQRATCSCVSVSVVVAAAAVSVVAVKTWALLTCNFGVVMSGAILELNGTKILRRPHWQSLLS